MNIAQIKKQLSSPSTGLAWLLVIGGFIGLTAAFILTLDKLTLLTNPDYNPACNINPVLSCGSIIGTEQASAFGFPNPLIGIAGFSVVITVGMGILAGARYKLWFRKGLLIGTLLGLLFVHWLIYQSFYVIEALCIYCMVVWSVVWPMFLFTLIYAFKDSELSHKRLKQFISKLRQYKFEVLISWYLIIITLIIIKFWYYWKTIL